MLRKEVIEDKKKKKIYHCLMLEVQKLNCSNFVRNCIVGPRIKFFIKKNKSYIYIYISQRWH